VHEFSWCPRGDRLETESARLHRDGKLAHGPDGATGRYLRRKDRGATLDGRGSRLAVMDTSELVDALEVSFVRATAATRLLLTQRMDGASSNKLMVSAAQATVAWAAFDNLRLGLRSHLAR
jgi:hypothetical protein